MTGSEIAEEGLQAILIWIFGLAFGWFVGFGHGSTMKYSKFTEQHAEAPFCFDKLTVDKQCWRAVEIKP